MGLSLRPCFLFAVTIFVLLLACHDNVVAAVDPGEDFSGYMENLEQRRQDEQRYREKLHAHEVWRQTTWGGWATRQLQAVGNHFAPFFEALSDAIAAEGDSAGSMALMILIRILTIGFCITFVYGFSRMLNLIVGGEIVVEEEVIVVEEDDDDDAAAASSETKKQK